MNQQTLGAGFSIVEMAIIALVLVLVGHRIGLPISVFTFAIAVCIAATLHYAGRRLWRLLRRGS